MPFVLRKEFIEPYRQKLADIEKYGFRDAEAAAKELQLPDRASRALEALKKSKELRFRKRPGTEPEVLSFKELPLKTRMKLLLRGRKKQYERKAEAFKELSWPEKVAKDAERMIAKAKESLTQDIAKAREALAKREKKLYEEELAERRKAEGQRGLPERVSTQSKKLSGLQESRRPGQEGAKKGGGIIEEAFAEGPPKLVPLRPAAEPKRPERPFSEPLSFKRRSLTFGTGRSDAGSGVTAQLGRPEGRTVKPIEPTLEGFKEAFKKALPTKDPAAAEQLYKSWMISLKTPEGQKALPREWETFKTKAPEFAAAMMREAPTIPDIRVGVQR